MASNSSVIDLAPPLNIPLPSCKPPVTCPSSGPSLANQSVKTSNSSKYSVTRTSPASSSFATLKPYEPPRSDAARSNRAAHYPSTVSGELETFVKFYSVRSKASADLRKLNIFKVDQAVCNAIGEPARITENPDHSLTVEVKSRAQGQKLLSLTTLVREPVEVVPHQRYNQSQGVITCDLLKSYAEDDIADGLSHLGVTKVHRITKRSPSGTYDPTPTLVLTFNTSVPPDRIRIRAGLSERVRPYVPLPRRCYKCQQYGHVTKTCRKEQEICGRCGTACSETHATATCQRPFHCLHCDEPHSTSSKTCPRYIMEKEIIALKVKERLTFKEARHRVLAMFPAATRAFSSVVRSQARQSQPPSPRVSTTTAPTTQHSVSAQPRPSCSDTVQPRTPRPEILRPQPTHEPERLCDPNSQPFRAVREAYVSPERAARGLKRASPTSPPHAVPVGDAQKRPKAPDVSVPDRDGSFASPMDTDARVALPDKKAHHGSTRPRSSSIDKRMSGTSQRKHSLPRDDRKKGRSMSRDRKS